MGKGEAPNGNWSAAASFVQEDGELRLSALLVVVSTASRLTM